MFDIEIGWEKKLETKRDRVGRDEKIADVLFQRSIQKIQKKSLEE